MRSLHSLQASITNLCQEKKTFLPEKDSLLKILKNLVKIFQVNEKHHQIKSYGKKNTDIKVGSIKKHPS